MNKMINQIVNGTLLLLLCFLTISELTDAQSKTSEMLVEGTVVAFNKANRCPSCEGSKSIGTPIENWIIRVDKWKDDNFDGNEYILVEYQIYTRSLSDSEMNKKLEFTLRERKEHEQNQDCVGQITSKKGEDYLLRPVELSDYEITESGKLESIPADFKKLPCFIVDRLPKTLN